MLFGQCEVTIAHTKLGVNIKSLQSDGLRCLVMSVLSMEAIPSRLPLLSWIWKRLLRDPVRAPDSSSCPEEASTSKPSSKGPLFLRTALEGSDTPRAAPWIFLGGVEGFWL